MIAPTLEQSPDRLARAGRPQRPHETVVAQGPRYVLQRSEMIAGPILRRDEQHEHIDRLAVQRVEGDAAIGDRDSADEPVDAGVLGMRNGDAAADAGRAERLALED